MGKVEMKNGVLKIDGKEFRIFSGAIHYFRVHPDLWEDRLLKLKACGLNTVETYIPWNLHEPEPGKFNFSGLADLEGYLRLCGKKGLKVIARPGPYICSEWDFGGLPSWLLNRLGIRLRCSEQAFLKPVEKWFDKLLPTLRPFLHGNGGPIVATQIENEYGSYGNDKEYLEFLRGMYVRHGIDAVHFTSDGASDLHLDGGTLDDVWKTVNYGFGADASLETLRRKQPDMPLMCAEFWGGQGMRWGVSRRLRDPENVGESLKKTLAKGAHVNIYMFHGGTNFGFMNGALELEPGQFHPFITSYDVDAPLNEAGDPTPKYFEFRKIISAFNRDFDPEKTPVPKASEKRAYGKVRLGKSAPLMRNLKNLAADITKSVTTKCMEELGQDYGFILYRTRIKGPRKNAKLSVVEPRDRAMVFLDGRPLAVFHRNDKSFETTVDIPGEGADLDILVENMGRTDFGPFLEDNRKGVSKGVRIDFQYHFGWEIFTLPMRDLSGLDYGETPAEEACPVFFMGEFDVDDPRDTFLKIPHGTKGCCWINGFNLGRYWNTTGPQFTLYVPAPLLKKGVNRVEVFETDGMLVPEAVFQDRAEV